MNQLNLRYRPFFFLFAFLLVGHYSFAQKKKMKSPKSEEKEMKSAPSSISKMPLPRRTDALSLIKEAEMLKTKNPALAIEKLEESLSISIQDGNKTYEAQCYQILGAINLQNGLNESAVRQTQKAYDLFSELKNEPLLSKSRFQLAEALLANKQLDEALKLFNEQVEKGKNQKTSAEVVKAKYRIAEIQTKQGKTSQALATYQEILSLEKERNNDEGIAEANKRIGEFYQSKRQNKKALEYYKDAQDIAGKGNDAKTYSEINKNISEVVSEDEVLDLRMKSLEKSQETKEPEIENKENLAIANTYLERNQSQTAIPYLKRSLELSNKLGQLEEKGEALKSLSEAYKQQNQFEKAMLTFQKYLAVKDTLIKQKEREIERMMNSNINIAEKQKRIDLLEKDVELNKQTIAALSHEQVAKEERLSRQRVYIYSLIFGLVLILVASYIVYKNSQKRRIANQLLALKSLRSQMNPHFIFNALNSVNSFISKNDERSANKYLADFSRLMRMVMENSQHDFVPLSQEISILELYLTLEHFRFQEKFDYTFEVDEEIDTDAYEVPPMLIQPYIENAIWHGLRYKLEKGQLNVAFRKNIDKSLAVVIEDNGIGRKKSAELKTINQKTSNSTGIKNTESRIALINELYKKNIQIESADLLPEEEETGTRVVIGLPKKS